MTPFCLPRHAQRVQFCTHQRPMWAVPGVFYTEPDSAGRFDAGDGVSFAVAEVCAWEGDEPRHCTPGCRQRPACPLRSEPLAPAPKRSCDALGVCQGKGCLDCEHTATAADAGDGYPLPLWSHEQLSRRRADALLYWGAIVVCALVTVVTVCGAAGYLYGRFGQQLVRALWSVTTLWT